MSDPAADFVTALPFDTLIGVRADGDALALLEADALHNHVGTVHAGALFTLGEAASGVAIARGVALAHRDLATWSARCSWRSSTRA